MHPVYAHRVHVGAITALIIVMVVTIGRGYSSALPAGYEALTWFWMIYSGIVIALLAERLRQIAAKSITVDPRPGIETVAVYTGHALIFSSVPGYIVAFFYVAPDGPVWARLVNSMSVAGLWVGLALIELVIANGRDARLSADHKSTGFARIVIGIVLLGAGFSLGVAAVYGFFLFGLRH